jgi:parallel beta-helix repeat protein
VLGMLGTSASGRTIYVDMDANGANDGSSWANAFNYLQDALAEANSIGGPVEIRVAEGTYTPDSNSVYPNGTGDREATFRLISGVTIRGGYAGYGTPDPNLRDVSDDETILSGSIGLGSNSDNSYHVVTGSGTDETAILDGLTIASGNANGIWVDRTEAGGGMLNQVGSPTLTNCTFSWNRAIATGGGMHNEVGSSPTLTNCTFSGNRAASGGGMFNHRQSRPTLTNCTFNGNWASGTGGGMYNYNSSNPTVTNCTFSGNRANAGGGVSNYKSSPALANCTFNGNPAGASAGGMLNQLGSPTLTNCTFSGNSADRGGGMYNYNSSNPTLTNCTFSGNWSSVDGGGMYNEVGSSPTVTNCTFAANSAYNGNAIACDSPSQSSPSSVQLANCILWDSGNEIWNNDGSTITITYSDVQGGWPGEGNIDADPCFVESGYWDANGLWVEGDYHLLRTSPCVDAASDANVYTDIEGNIRPFDFPGVDNNGELPEFDMGAYELTPVEAEMQFTPQSLNCSSKGNWVKAHIILPEEILPDDVDVNTPAIAYPMETESEYIHILGNDDGLVSLDIAFDREAFCSAVPDTNDGYLDVTVIGSLTTGRLFYAIDTIKIFNRHQYRHGHRHQHNQGSK